MATLATSSFDPSTFAILVVDDEPMNRDLLSRRLERRGYFTLVASSGPEALERIDGAGCDLVLLDIMMPGMSGIEVLTEVRKTRSREDLPIIMASARNESESIASALQSGANDYVTKPLDFAVVLARVQTQLAMKSAVERLRATEARFRMLADLSADLVSLHGPDGAFRYASPSCRELLGFEPEELEGRRLWDLVHPSDRDALPSVADLPDSCTLVMRLGHKQGNWVWVEMKARTQRGSRTGKVTDLQCTTRDVSFYVDAWQGGPVVRRNTVSEAVRRTTTHPEIDPTILLHEDRVVTVSVDPPPVRKRRIATE